MRLEGLRLSSFRNLEDARLSFPPGLTVIHGANAQGKTNLLEAVFAVITGSSHRSQRDQEMIARGRHEAFAEAVFERPSGSLVLSLHLSLTHRKARRRNGKAFRAGEDPLGDPRVILFSPEDLALAQGAPSERRRFVDVDLGQARPAHARLVRQYARATAQRNGALRAGRGDLLPAFDALWAPLALRLTAERRALIEAFLPFAQRAHAGIAPEDGALTVTYIPNLGGGDIEAVLRRLFEVREEEAARKTTVLGPHRDDIRLSIGDNDLRAYGSQGQQRTAAVAMKVGAASFLGEADDEIPLLLLDDVLSELDQNRREALAEVVRRGQALLTTADDGTLPSALQPTATMTVERGRVRSIWNTSGT